MKRPQVPGHIRVDRVIAIARRVPRARLLDVADVVAAKGIRAIEVTLDGDDALGTISLLAERDHLVGAGTVRTAEQALAAADSGAAFLVSPHTSVDIVTSAVERGVPVMAGAMTPSEVVYAWDLRVSAVKLFPASVGGPGFLKALRGPLSDIDFVPTGGIDASNAGAYLAAGAVAVGVGGWLTSADDLATVEERATALAEVAKATT